jgi:hypothetical protein
MNDPKPFASLSPSLLARKGHAKPAMRRQAFAMPHELDETSLHHDDLGWNDMGHDHEPPVSEPVALHGGPVPEAVEPPPVVAQQEQLARDLSPPRPVERAPVVAPTVMPRAVPGSRSKAAFTLRLDAERHLRLRLVCAVAHRSAQQVVTQALDEFLARQPGNDELARQHPRIG